MKESQIRPDQLFKEYLALCRQDTETYFGDHSRFARASCPACGSESASPAFDKLGFTYVVCDRCQSLYNSPRPPLENIRLYYNEAPSVKFWATDFYKKTQEGRRKLIIEPRARLIMELCRKHHPELGDFLDLGSGYGILLEELAGLGWRGRVTGLDASPDMCAVCREKGFEVRQGMVEEIPPDDCRAAFATSFEVLEHLFEPLEFLLGAKNALEPGGLLLLTTLTCSGFDVRVLGERSNSVHPPHHLNLLSVRGVQMLFERAGLEVLELVTPGKLDVEIVRKAAAKNPEIALPPFIDDLVNNPDESVSANFQEFLAENRLSSHLRVLARKPAID